VWEGKGRLAACLGGFTPASRGPVLRCDDRESRPRNSDHTTGRHGTRDAQSQTPEYEALCLGERRRHGKITGASCNL
jgi:hypothetical protein